MLYFVILVKCSHLFTLYDITILLFLSMLVKSYGSLFWFFLGKCDKNGNYLIEWILFLWYGWLVVNIYCFLRIQCLTINGFSFWVKDSQNCMCEIRIFYKRFIVEGNSNHMILWNRLILYKRRVSDNIYLELVSWIKEYARIQTRNLFLQKSSLTMSIKHSRGGTYLFLKRLN